MHIIHSTVRSVLVFAFFFPTVCPAENLVDDPSFEVPKERDRFGLVFAKWSGWKYEGDCSFEVGQVARTGKLSCLLKGGAGAKIRVTQNQELVPGRYRITAYIRGLDIGTGKWRQTTEFMFNGKYMQLEKNGTFGWTQLSYVADLKEKKKVGPSFGMMAPGYLWIDDVTVEKVGENVPLTDKPLIGTEEAPIAPPGEIGEGFVRCLECGYRSMLDWKSCYACGTLLEALKAKVTGPPVRSITSFEDKNPFHSGTVVEQRATDGKKAMRMDGGYVSMDAKQDWVGFDNLKVDTYTDCPDPMRLYVEIRDDKTTGYWTRVNYQTIVAPGRSTLVLPVKQLYVGEKSRPGRMLDLANITRLVFSIDKKPPAPLYIDNIVLERDEEADKVAFDGLYAFDFGKSSSPVLKGFTRIDPGTTYSKGRGYGLRNAKIWRTYDVLQPEPLYQDFICVESGGLAVDVPSGRYRVFVNMDNPSGFWGEYQSYPRRSILVEGREVVADTMDLESFRKKYFRFWSADDLPSENTFDKYQRAYYGERSFEVDVSDGQLNVEFKGQNWACSVSAVVVYPATMASAGKKFLGYAEDKRRFHFDNYFRRVLHRPAGDPLSPTAEDQKRGYVIFHPDPMKDVYYNDTPLKSEVAGPLKASAFAGEYEPIALGVLPLRDLGNVEVTVGDLNGPDGSIPANAIDAGHVSYRVSRVTMEGSVYSIKPRLIMPQASVAMPKGITRCFWLTVRTPASTRPGIYRGLISIRPVRGESCETPVEFNVRKGTLDTVDIPAGPWGFKIRLPFNDDKAREWENKVALKCLKKMRSYGFTMFSGAPSIVYRGFRNGKPVLDFSEADRWLKVAKELGFLSVSAYGSGLRGLNGYYRDLNKMKAAGFQDYSQFIKAVYTDVQKHADEQGWIPVYYNLCDEPIGDNLKKSAENAEAYRKAFPTGPPFFSGASSFRGGDAKDPHFRLSKALHVPNWNLHDEAGVNLIRKAGGDWAFYNGGNRWTYGTYLYKAVKQFRMKFRISWHWNICAGDPYYALDCREDDYAWCNSSPEGELIPSLRFERLREGLDDYRRLLTLARLSNEKAGTPAAAAGEKLVQERLAAFKLGQRDHDAIFGASDWNEFRKKLDDAIEAFR